VHFVKKTFCYFFGHRTLPPDVEYARQQLYLFGELYERQIMRSRFTCKRCDVIHGFTDPITGWLPAGALDRDEIETLNRWVRMEAK
jgi:hypothetical protein